MHWEERFLSFIRSFFIEEIVYTTVYGFIFF